MKTSERVIAKEDEKLDIKYFRSYLSRLYSPTMENLNFRKRLKS